MSKPTIPATVKQKVDKIVAAFNKKVIKDPNLFYTTRYKGTYLYLDRYEYDFVGHVCQLQYTGDMNKWEFAIFKYSRGTYDPDEWLFDGARHVDGTIVGAMKAGLEAYPE